MRISGKSFLVGALFTILTISSAFSAEILVAKFYKKSNHDQSKLYIITDENGDVVKCRFDILDGNEKIEASIPVSSNELRSGKVVLRKKGIDVISLKSEDFENHNGGYITLTHLKKWRLFGSNKYAKLEILLDRNGDDWELFFNGQQFTELYAHDHSKGIDGFSIKK